MSSWTWTCGWTRPSPRATGWEIEHLHLLWCHPTFTWVCFWNRSNGHLYGSLTLKSFLFSFIHNFPFSFVSEESVCFSAHVEHYFAVAPNSTQPSVPPGRLMSNGLCKLVMEKRHVVGKVWSTAHNFCRLTILKQRWAEHRPVGDRLWEGLYRWKTASPHFRTYITHTLH